MATKGIGIISVAALLYKQLLAKGVFALIRFKQDGQGTKLQVHADWDCDDYKDVVDHAKRVNKNQATTPNSNSKEKP